MKIPETEGYLAFLCALFLFVSCEKENNPVKMVIKGEVEGQTKVSDAGFENGDEIGIFVVDYSGTTPGTLSATLNHATNVKHLYTSSSDSWSATAGAEIYWNDATTSVDVYGYYPYSTVSSVTAHQFAVNKNQSSAINYFLSDFLWGKATSVTPGTNPVLITFAHKLSRIVITLEAGDGYTAEEFSSATKSMQILNVKNLADINLSNGVASANSSVSTDTIFPFKNANIFTAIVVPQTVASTSTFVKVRINDIDYYYRADLTLNAGIQYNITLNVSKNNLNVKALNSISAWTVNLGDFIYNKEAYKPRDIDGYGYNTITIGNQVWFAENLRTTKYANGDPIPSYSLIGSYSGITTGAYTYYDRSDSLKNIYGLLYNWFAVKDARGLCPSGWRVPSFNDFIILDTYLGGVSVAGGKLKEAGLVNWNSSNYGATNETGFSGLPGGQFDLEIFSGYMQKGDFAYFWSSDENSSQNIYGKVLSLYKGSTSDYGSQFGYSLFKESCISVRCIKN